MCNRCRFASETPQPATRVLPQAQGHQETSASVLRRSCGQSAGSCRSDPPLSQPSSPAFSSSWTARPLVPAGQASGQLLSDPARRVSHELRGFVPPLSQTEDILRGCATAHGNSSAHPLPASDQHIGRIAPEQRIYVGRMS